jgi:hypothetical protein
LKVAVTVTLLVRFSMVQVVPALMSHPVQPPKVPFGTAVNVTVVPVGKLPVQEEPVLDEQPRPAGELDMVPEPVPAKSTVTVGPVPVKQTTMANVDPVTTAPDDDTPDPSWFVVTLADTRVLPQSMPVAVSKPADVTVKTCGVLEAQVT